MVLGCVDFMSAFESSTVQLGLRIWDYMMVSRYDRLLILGILTIISLKLKQLLQCDDNVSAMVCLAGATPFLIFPRFFLGNF